MSNDGRNVLYDPEYLAGLSDGHQMFVLAHELCHIAFGHASRLGRYLPYGRTPQML